MWNYFILLWSLTVWLIKPNTFSCLNLFWSPLMRPFQFSMSYCGGWWCSSWSKRSPHTSSCQRDIVTKHQQARTIRSNYNTITPSLRFPPRPSWTACTWSPRFLPQYNFVKFLTLRGIFNLPLVIWPNKLSGNTIYPWSTWLPGW